MGCLLFDDHAFCRYLAKLLEGTVIIPLWKSVAWICLTHCKRPGLGFALHSQGFISVHIPLSHLQHL